MARKKKPKEVHGPVRESYFIYGRVIHEEEAHALIAEERAAYPSTIWTLEFVGGDGEDLGRATVEAHGFVDAVVAAARNGDHPGGEVRVVSSG